MQFLTFEFDQESEMREVARRLWEGLGVTGEIHIMPQPAGRWRLVVNSEKELRESTLKTFERYRVDTPAAGAPEPPGAVSPGDDDAGGRDDE